MSELALVPLLTAHLVCVNLAMANPLACAWLDRRGTRHGDALAAQLCTTLARLACWMLSVGIVLGAFLLAARWLRGDQAYLRALATIPATRWWFGLGELLFYFACMGLYLRLRARGRGEKFVRPALAIAAALNLLLHFPALFTIASVLSTREEYWGQVLNSAQYRGLLIDGEILSRVVHVWLSAFSAVGIVLMIETWRARQQTSPAGKNMLRRAAALALVPALLQLPVGLWVSLELPEPARQLLLGGDWLASGMFLTALLLTLQLLHTLTAILLGDDDLRQVRRAAIVLLLLFLMMLGARSRLLPRSVAGYSTPRVRALALRVLTNAETAQFLAEGETSAPIKPPRYSP